MKEAGEPAAGVVSFLFTDIEASTWLLQHLGEDYDVALRDHNRILRDVWAQHGGHEVSTEGDAFFVAFADARAALSAARDAQRRLAAHTWPKDVSVRVRIGIHTGEARLYEDDYIGLAVHQAARVTAAAHGGQVIVSDATRQAGGDDFAFIELGLHRLKDLAQPVRLYQLAGKGLQVDFPAPRSLSGVPNNFPLQLTTFIGREDDIEQIRRLLKESRIVTLTGAGGVGKTRLALQVAAEILADYPDGAWLVDLAPLADPEALPGALAAALGVREQPGRPLIDTITDHLLPKKLLIVLDNCEHVIEASANLAQRVLASARDVTLLATSRESLNVKGEVAWRLRSLSLPDPDGDAAPIARSESVRLFTQRARAARPGFELHDHDLAAVAQVCRRLDGLPLAIELAAARVRTISVRDLANRLDDRFRLLTGGARMALPRQRTLEATVAWSYELLSEPERLLFERLSVFAGGCALEAAEEACSDAVLDRPSVFNHLSTLVDRSLVIADESEDGRMRYRMLETLRQFGRERLLARSSAEQCRDRHLRWAADIAPKLPPQTGARMPAEFAVELDNLRTAVEWSIESGKVADGLRIVAAAWFGSHDERERWYERLLAAGKAVPASTYLRALRAAGENAFSAAQWAAGSERFRTAADVALNSGDYYEVAMSLAYGASCRWALDDEETAKRWFEESIAAARRSGSTEALIRALLFTCWFEIRRNLQRAEVLATEAMALAEGDWDRAHALEVSAYILCVKEDYRRAADALAQALSVFKRVLRVCSAHAFEAAAAWAAMVGRYELGAELWGAADRIRWVTGDKARPWERDVQERWLPLICRELDRVTLDAARERGRSRPYAEVLAYAVKALRSYALT